MEDFCPLLQERQRLPLPSAVRFVNANALDGSPHYAHSLNDSITVFFVLTWSWDRPSCYPIDFTSNSFLDTSFTLMRHFNNILVGHWLGSLSVHSWRQYGEFSYPSILTATRNSRYYNIGRLKVFCSL